MITQERVNFQKSAICEGPERVNSHRPVFIGVRAGKEAARSFKPLGPTHGDFLAHLLLTAASILSSIFSLSHTHYGQSHFCQRRHRGNNI